MSVRVALHEIPAQIARFGPGAFLVTVGDDGRPHPASVLVTAGDAGLSMGGGRRTCTNVAARPDVTVLFAGPDADGFALLVDGRASVGGDGAVVVSPTSAILHKLHAAE
jgi:hypothetical protein